MRLLLLHGPPASGKLTIARAIAARRDDAVFHNHLVVDAVAALFAFGTPPFIRLRERIWRELLLEAARDGRDTIFTFAPEPTVSGRFIPDLLAELRAAGAEIRVVALTLPDAEQDRRIANGDRRHFGKLVDRDLLHLLRPAMAACSAAMPRAALTLDTSCLSADEAAARIIEAIG